MRFARFWPSIGVSPDAEGKTCSLFSRLGSERWIARTAEREDRPDIELRGILDAQYPNCTISPCTTISGETRSYRHWSSSSLSFDPVYTWYVDFDDGDFIWEGKIFSNPVRAVRDSS